MCPRTEQNIRRQSFNPGGAGQAERGTSSGVRLQADEVGERSSEKLGLVLQKKHDELLQGQTLDHQGIWRAQSLQRGEEERTPNILLNLICDYLTTILLYVRSCVTCYNTYVFSCIRSLWFLVPCISILLLLLCKSLSSYERSISQLAPFKTRLVKRFVKGYKTVSKYFLVIVFLLSGFAVWVSEAGAAGGWLRCWKLHLPSAGGRPQHLCLRLWLLTTSCWIRQSKTSIHKMYCVSHIKTCKSSFSEHFLWCNATLQSLKITNF